MWSEDRELGRGPVGPPTPHAAPSMLLMAEQRGGEGVGLWNAPAKTRAQRTQGRSKGWIWEEPADRGNDTLRTSSLQCREKVQVGQVPGNGLRSAWAPPIPDHVNSGVMQPLRVVFSPLSWCEDVHPAVLWGTEDQGGEVAGAGPPGLRWCLALGSRWQDSSFAARWGPKLPASTRNVFWVCRVTVTPKSQNTLVLSQALRRGLPA